MQASQLPLKGTATASGQGLAALVAWIALCIRYLPLEPGRILAHQGSYVLFNIVGAINAASDCSRLIKHGPLDRPELGRHLFNVLIFKSFPAALLSLGSGLLFFGVTRHTLN